MKQVDMVREFMRVFGQETPEKQKLPDESTMALRVRLTSEENAEMATSITTAEYFDAVLDKLYVAFGDAVAAGFTAEEVRRGFGRVHNSNMSKLWTEDEVKCGIPCGATCVEINSLNSKRFLVKRADGKVIKSASYSPVRFDGIIQ